MYLFIDFDHQELIRVLIVFVALMIVSIFVHLSPSRRFDQKDNDNLPGDSAPPNQLCRILMLVYVVVCDLCIFMLRGDDASNCVEQIVGGRMSNKQYNRNKNKWKIFKSNTN